MSQLTSIERERIDHINSIMNDLHESINNIYEMLMDREYCSLRLEIKSTEKQLKSIKESIEDAT